LPLLVTAIWEASKKERKSGVSKDLITISKLLCTAGLDVTNNEIDMKSKDADVAIRVRTRLWEGGRFWCHTLADVTKTDTPKAEIKVPSKSRMTI